MDLNETLEFQRTTLLNGVEKPVEPLGQGTIYKLRQHQRGGGGRPIAHFCLLTIHR